MWRQIPAEIRPLQLVVLFPGTSGFICSNGKCAGCRELYLGAQPNDVWITSLLLVCEVHTLRGSFITPSSLLEEGEGNSRREKKVEGRSGGTQTREEVVWGASSQLEWFIFLLGSIETSKSKLMGQKHFPGAQKCKSTINQRGSLQEEARSRGREKQAEEQTPEAVSPLMGQTVPTLPQCSEDMSWAAQGVFLGCSSLTVEEPDVGACCLSEAQ